MQKKYNIGLDIGTTSVGWAVVEADTQKIIRKGKGKKRKALWGVRLFDAADTAEERRNFRSTRRRYDRRRQRIKLLQDEFSEEIKKVDENFFQKLKESKYHEDDLINKTIFLTNDEKQQLKEYNEKYKTIYHLRNRLINDSSKEDIRLVYLAIHHIIKYRGNFLYTGDKFNVNSLNIEEKINNVFDAFINYLPSINIDDSFLEIIDMNEFEKALLKESKNDVKVETKNILGSISNNKNFINEFIKLIVGNKFSIKKLFMLEDLEQDITLSLDGADYDDKILEAENCLGDSIEILHSLKELYDAVFLKKLFKGSSNASLSYVMVERYKSHKEDLRFLKDLFDGDRSLYNKLFKTKKEMCLYDKYIHNSISYEDFIKELEKLILKLFDNGVDESLSNKWLYEVKEKIDKRDFLPRITDPENGKYPYQLNKDELIKIIENQGKYYPFLLEEINGKYKIVKLLEFKIPYYVGPLVSDKKSKFAWMERKSDEKITPYNFDQVVNKEVTAEKFIKRMISHCTYLFKEFALPNNSILYSKYKVMNELKQIKINGQKLENDLQHKIMEEFLMKTSGNITDKKFKEYLNLLPEFDMYQGDLNITGYSADLKFANNMQSYIDFFGDDGIFKGTSYDLEDADEIIEWITIFEDKDILKRKIENKYHELTEEQKLKILNKKYKGWGNLSKKLLMDLTIKDKETGVAKNIMTLMYETKDNFMQIINDDKYKFQDLIKENNIFEDSLKINYDLVKELATSPATKKGIYQSLKVVEEIIKYMGYEPENIMIEMARGDDIKKQRKDDRKKYLLNLYKKVKEDCSNYDVTNYETIFNELNSLEKIDSQKLFLYFIQEGKCLYTGNPINIEDLNSDKYEIDHIIPRTLIKDDSIDNKALVYRECNQAKAASFVLPKEYRTSYMKKWWNHLKKIGLISAKKFYKLTREYYSDEDINGFINRQLVETRQITKHVANILNCFYKDTKIVYLKANLSHNYREKYELFKFREINDYHHAHDAYLTAVLGEFKEKYMTRNINYQLIKGLNNKLKDLGKYKQCKYGFVINSLDEDVFDVVLELSKNFSNEETGEVLFDSKRFNNIVENTLYRNDILISRKTEIRSGQLFKQKIYSKNVGNVKIKDNMPTELYGGYSNIETSYLTLAKYKSKLKLIGIPLEIALKSKNILQTKYNFIKEHLKEEDIKIVKDFIPFETLINYNGQDVYIKGYSSSNKNCEVSNATQLKIPKEKLKLWKNILNEILNKKSISNDSDALVDTEKSLEIMKDIILYLFNLKKEFPLFLNEINKIENKITLDNLNYNELKKIIIELFKIYHCNSVNGNLKEFGLGERIGRLSGKNITKGIIKANSITRIKEIEYEF